MSIMVSSFEILVRDVQVGSDDGDIPGPGAGAPASDVRGGPVSGAEPEHAHRVGAPVGDVEVVTADGELGDEALAGRQARGDLPEEPPVGVVGEHLRAQLGRDEPPVTGPDQMAGISTRVVPSTSPCDQLPVEEPVAVAVAAEVGDEQPRRRAGPGPGAGARRPAARGRRADRARPGHDAQVGTAAAGGPRMASEAATSPGWGDVGDVTDMLAALSGFRLQVACRSSDYRFMSALVGAGVGVALVPSLALTGSPEVRALQITPQLTRYIGATPYKKVTAEGVRVEKVLGKDMLVVSREALRALSEAAFGDINHYLRPGHLKQLRAILDDKEASDNDKFVAFDFLKNANIAAGGVLPMCQDTGTAIIMGKKGCNVITDGDDEAALSRRRARRLSAPQPALFAGRAVVDV